MTNCNKIICFLKFPTYTSQFYESPKSNNSGWGETIRHWWGELSETNLHFFVAVFVSISILIRTIRRISISKCPFLKISISIGTFLDILISIRKTFKIRHQFQRTGDDVFKMCESGRNGGGANFKSVSDRNQRGSHFLPTFARKFTQTEDLSQFILSSQIPISR